MATLPDEKRIDLWAQWMRDNRAPISITKAELRAAVNAIDTWISDNTASFNSAIPQPARTNLSASQKAHLLMAIVKKRFEEGT